MKAQLIIILVILGLSTSATMRKLSSNNPKSIMLVGFSSYHSRSEQHDEDHPQTIMYFQAHFIKEKNTTRYDEMSLPISLELKNGSHLRLDINCTNINADDEGKKLIVTYFCFNDTTIINKPDIQSVTPIINFTFYSNVSSIRVTENDIDKSSYADTTIKNLTTLHSEIQYDIFYLDKIILNKNDEFILTGNLSDNESATTINLTLSQKKYNASVTKDKIVFKPSGTLDDYLHGKMEETIKNSTYVIIFAEKGVDDHLKYPVDKKIELSSFGNYTKPTANSDAYNYLYITGNQYILNGLEKFIRFNTTIKYNNLRYLEEPTTIEANGTLIENNQTKDIAVYNVTYYGTKNKNIISIEPPKIIEFSEDGTNYENYNENEISISPDLYLLEEEEIIIERMSNINGLKDNNSTSFTYEFNLTGDPIFNIGIQKDAYLKYHPNNNISMNDEIKCVVQHFALIYRMICTPTKNVYTNFNTTKIIILNITSSNSRLRALQSTTNRTILPPSDTKEIINFTYPNYHVYRKIKKSGLSAGAIVAIVLATIAAVAALGIAIFFLGRAKANPPPIRNPSDLNMANSTSNINN
jgi:uncharacterized short protein YbdD (DUF466 family)